MSEQYPPRPGSMLDIRPRFIPIAFFLYFCTPYYSINGSPAAAGRWKQNVVPVPPGRYQVTVWVKYLFRPQMGLSSIVVDVPPGDTAVITWRAPLTIFSVGRIAVAGVQASASAPQMYGSQSGPVPGVAGSQPSTQPPPRPQAAQAPSSAVGWYPDPTNRHQVRYFDGYRWSEYVSDGGVQARDPIAS